MSNNTAISWTNASWNPVTGCERVSTGCALGAETPERAALAVMTCDEAARASAGVEARECLTTATRTVNDRIVLIGGAPFGVLDQMFRTMVRDRGHDLKVRGAVVGLVTVAVMDDFTMAQWPAEHLFGDEAMFVDVTAHVGARMIRSLDQHIAVRCYCATALPVDVVCAARKQVLGHALSLTHGVLHGKEVMPHA